MDTDRVNASEGFRIRVDEDLPDHKILATLDDLDRDILEMHIKDLFFSYNELAEKWGVTSATIRNRIKRMKAWGVMDIILVVNPYKIGYPAFGIIGINLGVGGNANKVASSLLALPVITNVVMVAGRYDFFVHYACRNTEEYRHLINEIRKIPDISKAESFLGLDLYERKFELGVVGLSSSTDG